MNQTQTTSNVSGRRPSFIVVGLLVPLAAQTVLLVLFRTFVPPLSHGRGDVAALVISTILGFGSIVREFAPLQAVLAAIVYFPTIACLLWVWTFFLAGLIYGAYL